MRAPAWNEISSRRTQIVVQKPGGVAVGSGTVKELPSRRTEAAAVVTRPHRPARAAAPGSPAGPLDGALLGEKHFRQHVIECQDQDRSGDHRQGRCCSYAL